MDHLNQDDLLKLKSLRKEVDWSIKKQRIKLLRRVINLFNEWNGQLPNLLDVFRFYEIDWLISEVVSKHMEGSWEDIRRAEGLIDFVISTGYKNQPLVDEDGKPALNRTTPLHHAARNIYDIVKLRRVVGKLFEIYDRIDVNYIDESGTTHFHVACLSSCYDVVKGFLDFGQDPNQLLTETGESPLLLAFKGCGYNSVIGLLLRRGADPNLTDNYGLTPLHMLCENKYRELTVRKDFVSASDNCAPICVNGCREDLAKMLFEICDKKHVPVQVNLQDKLDRTPLHIALRHRSRTLMKMLLRRGADPRLADKEGNTALHLICMGDGYNRLLKKFFKICDDMGHKIQVNARNNRDETPLHLSLDYGTRHLVEFLLRRGADPNVVDKYKRTPLHIILESQSPNQNEEEFVEVFFNINDEIQQTVQVDVQDHRGQTPLFLALYWKYLKTAKYLLIRGAKPGFADTNRSTPLHVLSEMNDSIDLAKMLFEFSKDEIWCSGGKVNVNAQDVWGRTSLYLALRSNNKEVAKLLLKKGADLNLATVVNRWTPLHLISKTYYDNYDLVNKLFKISNKKNQLVQIDARDLKGRTPLQLAVANFLPGVVDALLDHGADLSSFVFPDSSIFKESFTSHRIEEFKLMSTSGAMPIVQCLEKRGYVVDRSDAMNIMKLFIEQGLFAKSAVVKINWDNEPEFVNKTKEVMINSSLSLYDLIRLRPEAAVKLLTYADCLAFAHSVELSKLPRGPKEAYTAHLCEIMSRRFFRRWALESFRKLIWHRLSIKCCKMIIKPLMNEDLYNICLTDQNQSLEGSQKNVTKYVIKCNNKRQKTQ